MTTGLQLGQVEVELYSVPGCPNVGRARRMLRRCLEDAGLSFRIVEHIGDYPSPTVLIDGCDVMDRVAAEPACRLDLPTCESGLRALAARHGEVLAPSDDLVRE